MKRFVSLTLVTAAILGAGSPGIRPRADVAEYPFRESADAAAFGVAVIPAGEAKKIFGADLSGYVVIEVGVFPQAGREVDLSPLDFTLLADPNSISERPADPDVIAAASAGKQQRQRPETESSEVSVTAGASIQHESYPDPATGRRAGTTIIGVNTGAGVGTPAEDPRLPAPPSASGSNRDQLSQQLWEKSVPDGKTAMAVAGYLYFPKPVKKSKNDFWVLRWENAAGRVKIVMPNPGK